MQRRKTLFVISLAVTAIVVNALVALARNPGRGAANGEGSSSPANRNSDQATQQIATEHAKYREKYLNSGFERQAGVKIIALAIVSEEGSFNRAINAPFEERFHSPSVRMITSLFQPAFLTDGLFDRALGGSHEVYNNLDLTKSVDVILLGKQEVNYSIDPSMENLVTANMRLELTAYFLATGDSQSWSFTSNGAGFKKTEARSAAEERLIKQLSKDPKLSLHL